MAESAVFPIPASLQDLERAPYDLLPYPLDFADSDEAERADSFVDLVNLVEQGNRTLKSGGLALFEQDEVWMEEDRIQALYTLVRKSTSLAHATRARLVTALCKALHILCSILSSSARTNQTNSAEEEGSDGENQAGQTFVVPQPFRDAMSCHLYMLFSIMFMTESEAKVDKGLDMGARGKGKHASNSRRDNAIKAEITDNAQLREACANAMLAAAQTMGAHKSTLWKRGVPDEAVIGLPCRIAYQMLESATGVIARKAASADAALGMIAVTVDSAEVLRGTVVAALVDLLHSFEHIAPLVAELCCLVSEEPTNRLATELLREIGRLDTSHAVGNSNDSSGKASGVKNIAPFISELAARKPRIVLANISMILPHLDSEPYSLRSSIATAIGHIILQIGKDEREEIANEHNDIVPDEENDNEMPDSHKRKATSREALLDVLIERTHDVSSFTRTAVLKTWASIVSEGALPVDRLMSVTAMAVDRLRDKTVLVRRSAMQVLTLLLENNPFLGDLDPAPYETKARELLHFVKNNIPATFLEVQDPPQTEDDEEKEQIENATVSAAISEAEMRQGDDNLSEQEIDFCTKVKTLKFASSALEFIHLFEHARESFEGMLLSANSSDVTEALRFFVRARHFKLPFAVTGMKQALALMWSTEASIRDEVLKAFVDVFIADSGTTEPLPSNQVAHNLLVLVGQASVSELASIEEAISSLVKKELISAEVFLILWSIASKATGGDARSAAFLVISMGSTADRSIVDSPSRLLQLLESGLGEDIEANRDWKTARAAAIALQRVGKPDSDPTTARALVLEQIAERLCVVARGEWCMDETSPQDTQEWFSACEHAINALFVICPSPDAVCAELIKGMYTSTFTNGAGSSMSDCHTLQLSRFFFVLGHVSLKLLVYTESISGAVRRANANKSLKMQETAAKAKKDGLAGQSDADEDNAIEAELGLAAEEEAENERKVADISEKEIVGRGLIGLFAPILVRVVGNDGGQFSSEILVQSATLALCKFMCISRSFCEKHLPLLFTALANAPPSDTRMRANVVVALGDLAFRFPNEFEPYTPRLYACLRDSSTKVRRHALMVLTHLIMNDMVKVKGQVCEIALCLRDEDARIRDMSRLLFHELSKRSNNPVYNLLPDIISQLSEMGVRKDEFRSIVSFVLGFIKKERQIEMLVDKLCRRFPKCTSISQKGDIAYCIAQLKMNEKGIKILNELFRLYKDALFDDDVMKSFTSIVTKAKKFAKPELKECLDEWESKLKECAAAGLEDNTAGEKAERAKARAVRRKAASRKSKSRRKSKRYVESDDESLGLVDEEESIDEFEFEDKENAVLAN